MFVRVVDVRKNSATYGKWLGVELIGENHKQIWVSRGLAHGFLVFIPTVEILYKTTDMSAKNRLGLSLKRLPG
jgi:dTDP-4-dehydrorhamnose 3,5-epimerase